MDINRLKQIIKEEILKEIKVAKPTAAKLIKVGNGYELAVGKYITKNDSTAHETPAGYEFMPGNVETFFPESKFLRIWVFYDDDLDNNLSNYFWHQDVDKLTSILNRYNIEFDYNDEEEDTGEFIIPVDQINNWHTLFPINEIKVETRKARLINSPHNGHAGVELAVGPYVTNGPSDKLLPGMVDSYWNSDVLNGDILLTVIGKSEEIEQQLIDKTKQILNTYKVKFTFIEPHYFTIPTSEVEIPEDINEIKVAPPAPSGWTQIQVDTDQDPHEDMQVEIYKSPVTKKEMSQFYDLVTIMKTPDEDIFTGASIKPKYWVELFVHYINMDSRSYLNVNDSGIIHDSLQKAKEEAFEQMRKITVSKKAINEIKIETRKASLVFVPGVERGINVDPSTGEKGEPKIVIGGKYMIARNNIKTPEDYIHVKSGDEDYTNSIGDFDYHIKVDKIEYLDPIKNLLDKYKIKYDFLDNSNDSIPYYSLMISFDQISNTERWIH